MSLAIDPGGIGPEIGLHVTGSCRIGFHGIRLQGACLRFSLLFALRKHLLLTILIAARRTVPATVAIVTAHMLKVAEPCIKSQLSTLGLKISQIDFDKQRIWDNILGERGGGSVVWMFTRNVGEDQVLHTLFCHHKSIDGTTSAYDNIILV